jgi:methionyl-tRNA formyltransferase
LRLAFAGTPAFAIPALEAVLGSGHTLLAVYTQPDRPAGRGRKLEPSPVKQRALAAGVPIRQPETLKDPATRAALAALELDLLIVVAYGLILPRAVLALPRHGCWNVHASLLPRWRGAAPIQRALAAGDETSGVCLMQMEAGLDTGPVLLQRECAIAPDDTGRTLHDRLAVLGAELLAEGLRLLADDALPAPVAQSAAGVSYAHKLDKREAVLDLTRPAAALERQVRAFDPWPIAELTLAGERLRVHAARALPAASAAAPGSVIALGPEGIDLATGEGVLRLITVQRDGGRPLPAALVARALPALAGRIK